LARNCFIVNYRAGRKGKSFSYPGLARGSRWDDCVDCEATGLASIVSGVVTAATRLPDFQVAD